MQRDHEPRGRVGRRAGDRRRNGNVDDDSIDRNHDGTNRARTDARRRGFPLPTTHVPSITAVAGYEHIVQKPEDKAPLIGLIRAGQSVPLADPNALTHGPGGANLGPCKSGWYSVKPRGYVCLSPNSTLDADDPRAVAAREVLPDADSSLPFHVGVAIGSPEYKRIPTNEEQHEHEKGLDDYLAHVPEADKVGAIDTTEGRPRPIRRVRTIRRNGETGSRLR